MQQFDINIQGLTNKEHYFHYEVDDAFFNKFDQSPVNEGNAAVSVYLDKSETVIRIRFDIEGTILLTCDRSLDPFNHTLNLSNTLYFQYSEIQEVTEYDDEVILIPYRLDKLNLAQYIYEFIGLSIPMKKLHPRYWLEEEEEKEEDESKLFYRTVINDDSEAADPRFEKLKELKNKIN